MNNPERDIANQEKAHKYGFNLIAIGTAVMFTLGAYAQQTYAQGKSEAPVKAEASVKLPTVHEQLKVLTQKLELTSDQQAKTKSILQEMDDAVQKLMQGSTLSHQQLLEKVRPLREKSTKQIQRILSEDQKKKLDQYLQGSHAEMHGKLSGGK